MNVRFLKSKALEELYKKIYDNLERYRQGGFGFLEHDQSWFFEGMIEVDELQLARISCTEENPNEIKNCEIIFNAFKDLTPYLARDSRIWTYLTHTLLLNYARTRWPIPKDDERAVKHIQRHFFAKGKRGIERDNAASRLWWMAFLCNRVKKLSLTEALKIFLFQSDVRANIIERPTTSQSEKIFAAIIYELHESFYRDKELFKRETFRPFMKKLNLAGGVKLLDALSQDEISKEIKLLLNN